MDFALSEIDVKTRANEGTEVPLTNLAGNPLLNAKKKPVAITVLGVDSDTYRRLNRALGRKRLQRLQKARGGIATDEEIDLQEKEDIELLGQITTGWSGVLDTKEKEIPFSLDNIIDLYTKYPPAREQVEKAMADRTRFIQPS